MKKKFSITLIAFCTLLFAFGVVNASAATLVSGTCGANLTWTLEDGILTITGQGDMDNWFYDSNSPWYSSRQDIVKVVMVNGVTSIGDGAFDCCTNLKNITIPDSVTSIGNYAFDYCDSLESLTLPNSVTSIGYEAFFSCDSLISITLPDGLTSISEYAFEYCTNLKSITIPDSVTSIGNYAFDMCVNLRSITIPDSVTSIGGLAFSFCTRLESITLGSGVTSIGNYAFDYCSNLKDVYYNDTVDEWNKISIGSYNDSLTNATIHCKESKYRINEITLKDKSGNILKSIPKGKFFASISFTNVCSRMDTEIILAKYSSTGAFKGLMHVKAENVPIDTTKEYAFYVDNSNGDVAKLKALCWKSFSSLTPIGNSLSFPAE